MTISRVTLCVVLLTACGEFRREIAEIQHLNAELIAEFHVPITTTITNGRVITLGLTVPDSAHDKMTAEDRQALALHIAQFARHHYPEPDSLDRITVVWTSRTDYGPVHVSRTYRGGSWTIDELKDDSSAGPTRQPPLDSNR